MFHALFLGYNPVPLNWGKARCSQWDLVLSRHGFMMFIYVIDTLLYPWLINWTRSPITFQLEAVVGVRTMVLVKWIWPLPCNVSTTQSLPHLPAFLTCGEYRFVTDGTNSSWRGAVLLWEHGKEEWVKPKPISLHAQLLLKEMWRGQDSNQWVDIVGKWILTKLEKKLLKKNCFRVKQMTLGDSRDGREICFSFHLKAKLCNLLFPKQYA